MWTQFRFDEPEAGHINIRPPSLAFLHSLRGNITTELFPAFTMTETYRLWVLLDRRPLDTGLFQILTHFKEELIKNATCAS